jgi:cobalt/nickel transport system ATP-binding protein
MSIELQSILYKNDAGTTVLDELNLTLTFGEKVGLTGRNGSGKTTLLHVMMGFLRPRSGQIRIDAQALRSERDFQRHRGGTLGMLFQNTDDQLFCPSVEDEVAFGPLNLKRSLGEVRETVERTLGLVGLAGFEKRVPQKLSGGEKRMVALASVLSMSPRFLLLDEPTAGLDDVARGRLLDVLKSIDAGMLIVTHDEELLASLCDHCVSLENGQIR